MDNEKHFRIDRGKDKSIRLGQINTDKDVNLRNRKQLGNVEELKKSKQKRDAKKLRKKN